MAGVLQTAADFKNDPTQADFGQLTGPTQGPVDYTVSDTSLVNKQLTDLLQSSSPYLEQARSRARSYANASGLMNSTLAATGGESAAIDAALPIASADAATYGRADEFNATNKNAFARDANNFGREAGMAKFQGVLAQEAQGKTLTEQGRIANQDLALRRDLGLGDLNLRGEISRGDLALRDRLGTADTNLRGELGRGDLALRGRALDTQQASDTANQRLNLSGQVEQVRQQSIVARANLENNPNLSAEAKAAAISSLTAQASQDIRELIRLSGVNLPTEWPDWINDIGPVTAPTAPREQIPTNPYFDDPSRGSTGGDGSGGSSGGY